MASNVKFEFLYHFVRSARTVCPSCVILLFMPASDTAPARVQDLLKFFKVEVFEYDSLLASYTAKQRAFHPSSTRWLLLHDHLSSFPSSKRYGAVMVTDVRDTVFQLDPFQSIVRDRVGVFVAMESSLVSIAAEGWNRGWIADCYGEGMISRVGSQTVSCSGTTLATWEEAKIYIKIMSEEIKAHEACERNGIDQGVVSRAMKHTANSAKETAAVTVAARARAATDSRLNLRAPTDVAIFVLALTSLSLSVSLSHTLSLSLSLLSNASLFCLRFFQHNVLVHTRALESASPGLTVYRESNEVGLIATVQSMPHLRRNEWGYVLNDKEEPVAVVHQVDRSSFLIDMYERQFPIIEEALRDKK